MGMNIPYKPIHFHLKRIGNNVVPYENSQFLDEFQRQIEEVESALSAMKQTFKLFEQGLKEFDLAEIYLLEAMANATLSEFYPVRDEKGIITNCVYFMRHTYSNDVKIGFTDNLAQRINGLDNQLKRLEDDSSPETKVACVLYIRSGLRASVLEELIHFDLDDARVRGEWFGTEWVIRWLKQYLPGKSSMIDKLAGAS